MSVAVRRAIYGKMAGDTTLTNIVSTRIYYQEAPDEATFPYVIFQQQAGTPTYAFATAPAMDNEIWMVKGVDRATSADVVDGIASRLDALLTDGVLSISGKTQLYLRRESDLPSYSEDVDGIRYIHAGALFRLVYA